VGSPLFKPPVHSSLSKTSPVYQRRPNWFRLGFLGLAMLIFFVAVFVFLQNLPGLQRNSAAIRSVIPSLPFASAPIEREQVLLLMGVDANQNVKVRNGKRTVQGDLFEGARTDSMMLIRLSPAQQSMTLVSLPRDSKVYLSESGQIGKLNSAFSMGGAEQARRVVESAFGIPVDHFMAVNFSGVHQLVNALGGIDVRVDKPMHYEDHAGGLSIHFQPGVHHMDGEQAEAFLRFRHDSLGDIGRIRRQQYFLSAVRKKLLGANLLQLPGILQQTKAMVQTDLEDPEILGLMDFLKKTTPSRVRMATLPGRPSNGRVSYWVISPEDTTRLLNRLFYDMVDPTLYPERGNQEASLKVALLSDKNISSDTVDTIQAKLESSGYTLACRQSGNYASSQFRETSFKPTSQETMAVRQLLPGLGESPTVFIPSGTSYEVASCSPKADFTVVVGEDWK
jgi:LCP family protein required for cell wall assembly